MNQPLRPEQLLTEWRSWGHQLSQPPSLHSAIGEGLTNRSYLLDSQTGPLVLRINRPFSQAYGIDRTREALILNSLAHTEGPNIGPDVIFQDAQHRYMVYRLIEGRLWTRQDCDRQENLQALKPIIERYQSIPLNIEPRHYKSYLFNYWRQLQAKNLVDQTIEQQWLSFLPLLDEQHWEPCLSHHDLTPENIIETSEGLRIIDWEYAHLGHPGLDWASITREQNTLASELVYWMNRLWHLLAKTN